MATAQQLRVHLDGALAHLTPRERLELGALLITEGLADLAHAERAADLPAPIASMMRLPPGEALDQGVMSIRDAAQRLGVCDDSAYAAAARGDFPAKKLGRRWVVPVAAFEQWLSNDNSLQGALGR